MDKTEMNKENKTLLALYADGHNEKVILGEIINKDNNNTNANNNDFFIPICFLVSNNYLIKIFFTPSAERTM